ncbi:MAG: 3'-5' exonuclease, partial [Planctomycetota bacterium]
LAYLRVIANPSDRQSLLRILNTPPRGVGRTTAEKIVKETSAGGDFWDAVDRLVEKKEIGGKALTGLSGLRYLLSKYRGRMRADPLRLAESCRALIEEIDYEGEIAGIYDQP